jgi:hypothetical protein
VSKIVSNALETARANQRAIVAEQENKRLNAILEYVAMMADVDIDDEGVEENAQ